MRQARGAEHEASKSHVVKYPMRSPRTGAARRSPLPAAISAARASALRFAAMTDAEREELDLYRRQDLLRRMQTISQEQWATGWRNGLEHDLYLMTFHGAPADYGMSTIEPGALAELQRLAALTRAWWVYEDGSGQPTVVALDEAERRFSKVVAEDESGKLFSMSIPEAQQLYEKAAADEWEHETIRLPWDQSDRHAYRLKSNPLFSLQPREAERDWELRFGKTTVAYVTPAWAKR
jgi:hypothetical protein